MKKLAFFLLISFCITMLEGCAFSSDISETPSDTNESTSSTSCTTVTTPDIPTYKTDNNSTGDVLSVKDTMVIRHQNGTTAEFYVYNKSTGETRLLYSVMGWGSVYSVDETSFLVSWKLDSERNAHFLRYDIESMESQEIQVETDAKFHYIGYAEGSYYYQRRSDTDMKEYSVCKLSPTGELVPVVERIEEPVCIAHNHVYYMRDGVISRCDLQGNTHQVVWDCSQLQVSDPLYFQMIDNTVFLSCYQKDTSWVFNLETGTTSLIRVELSPRDYADFDEFLYMKGKDGVYRVNKETLGTEKVSDLYASGLNVIGDVLYFSAYTEFNEETGYPASDIHVYAMELDTGNLNIVF